MSSLNQQRIIIFLIGAATIAAGVFSWRAGQIGSTAAADDRQSVSQTVREQEQEIEVALGFVNDLTAYITYAATYEEADALDSLSIELAQQDEPVLADSFATDAAVARRSATAKAGAVGVFGLQSLYQDLTNPSTVARDFDSQTQIEQLRAEVSTGPTAPGDLDPDFWAAEADSIRSRMSGIRSGVFVIILSLVILTIAQITSRLGIRVVAGVSGLLLFLTSTYLTATNYWF